MSKSMKRMAVIVLVGGVSAILLGFLLENVILPWPYRRNLKACLTQARTLEDSELSAFEVDWCFRTYPHFL
jgi:hypothetical protein